MNLYRQYASVNRRLARGQTLYWNPETPGLRVTESGGPGLRLLKHSKIGVYAGAGTSHSWLWFVDLFERMGFLDLVFLDEKHVQRNGLTGLDVLAVSGGDTFAVARALGARGAEQIKAFVERGGVYMGSCAGAYLPMNSSKEHLNRFNFADVKITNLSKTLPQALRMAHKCCSAYGCDFVFHPIREAVSIRKRGIAPFVGFDAVTAPMYGGPSMAPSDRAEVLATYEAFTPKTLFLLDEKIARDAFLGQAAAVRVTRGKGCFYLFGPHFEHPHYPESNQLVADAVLWRNPANAEHAGQTLKQGVQGTYEILKGAQAKKFILDIKRELSNARIVVAGLDLWPIEWRIGQKIYEPEKIRVFIESIWKRLKPLSACEGVRVIRGISSRIRQNAVEMVQILRQLKTNMDKEQDTHNLAQTLFESLHTLTILFFGVYFKSIADDVLK